MGASKPGFAGAQGSGEASASDGAGVRMSHSVTPTTVSAVDTADAAVATAAAGVPVGQAAGAISHQELRDALARSARRLAGVRLDAEDGEATLRAIVTGALEAIPSGAAASITIMDRRGTITTHAPSDELVAEIDALQTELGEGPCIDAVREGGGGITDATDLSDPADAPWPRVVPRAVEAGYGCVLSHRLVAGNSVGSLNLWGRAPGAFTDHDRLLAALLADQAAVALTGAQRVNQLHRGLASRDVIGRAKGILMERFRITDVKAFAMLVESSQNTNIKLFDVASSIVGDAEADYARDGGAPARPTP